MTNTDQESKPILTLWYFMNTTFWKRTMSAIKHNETAGDKHLPLRSEVGKISKIRRKMNYYGL